MACGLGLGILLVLVQAEHVRCLWAPEAQGSLTDNKYAGFSQQVGRLRQLGRVSPQSQVRQVFVSPRSLQSIRQTTATTAQRGPRQGLPTSSYAGTVSQTAQSPRPLPSHLVSKPNRQSVYSNRVSAPTVAKKSFGLSTAIASGATAHQRHQKALPGLSRTVSMSMQQGMKRPKKRLSSISTSAQRPEKSYSATLFGPVGQAPPGSHVRMQTYARAPAKKVVGRKPRGPKPRSWAAHPYMGQQYSVNGAKIQGSYKPRSSRVGASAPGYAPVSVYDIPHVFGGSAIRRLTESTDQKKVTVQKPQQTPTASHQKMAYKLQLTNVHPESKWSRFSKHQRS
ncbi:uncharacterized protein ACNS7B_013145 [Menidia menidia]